MRLRSAIQVAFALCLFLSVLGGLPPAAALAGCAAPITPGAWTGTFTLTVTGQGSQTTFAGNITTVTDTNASETVAGDMALQVACDGTLKGSLSNETLNSSVFVNVTFTNIKTGKSKTVRGGGSCTGTSRATVTDGSVALGSGGLPVFNLNATVTGDAVTCTDPDVQKIYNDSAGSTGYKATFTLPATRASATTISGTDWKTSDPKPGAMVDYLRKILGAPPTVVKSWVLNGPPLPVTVTPVPDAPVITQFTAKYAQYFLQGVQKVPNEYTATVDWKNGTASFVRVNLDGPVTDQFDIYSGIYKYPQEMSALPVGKYTVTAVAFNKEGQSSAPQTQEFYIAAIPPWAAQAAWSVDLNPGAGQTPGSSPTQPCGQTPACVVYRGEILYPNPAYTTDFKMKDWIPYIGGPWGPLGTQFRYGLAVSSLGTVDDGVVDGSGSFALGGDRVQNLIITGTTRAQITPNALTFASGNASVDMRPDFFGTDTIDLSRFVPGLNLVRGLWGIGWLVKDIIRSRIIMRAGLNGTGQLGVVNNRLQFASGSGVVRPNLQVSAFETGIQSLSLSVGGVGSGTVNFSLYPEIKLAGCVLQFNLFVYLDNVRWVQL